MNIKVKIILVAILLISNQLLFGQEDKDALIGTTKNVEEKEINEEDKDGWKKGGVITINFSQVALNNWAAGGLNSYSLNGMLSMFANYKKDKSIWDNHLDLGYGVINQFRQGEADKSVWIKSDDKLDFTSKYGRKAHKSWYYSAIVNLKTQMAPGYADPYAPDSLRITISDFFAPAYTLAAVGMDYKPNETFTMLIAPATSKLTFVLNDKLSDAGAFGVDKGKQIRSEIGVYLRMNFKKDIFENVNFSTKLEFFQNYQTFGHIDVNWETLTSMKVNKFISANLQTQLIYDDDIDIAQDTNNDGITDKLGPAVQFKEVFGVGLTYKF